MKKTFIWFAFVALWMMSCTQQNPTLAVEGAWELTREEYISGDNHDSYSYEYKENVWLFYEGHIAVWKYVEENGLWDGFLCDCVREYMVEGELPVRYIIETSWSTIPMPEGQEPSKTITRYGVEKLTTDEMILLQSESTRLFFRRENTLLPYLMTQKEK